MVRLLVNFLRFFNALFGLTQPRKDEEEKWAVFLIAVLAGLALMLAVAFYILLRIF